MRVLIAGFGNVLRGDDGFGVVALRGLADNPPENSTVLEVSIAGIGLAQELMSGYGAVIVLDAAMRGGEPGTIYLLEPVIDDPRTWSFDERREFAADTHYAEPSKALLLAKALGVLPPIVRVVACEPADFEDFVLDLSPPVARAVPQAVERVRRLIEELRSAKAA